MNKKILLLTTLLTTSLHAAPFNGFYIGAFGGFTQRAVETNLGANKDELSLKLVDEKTKKTNALLYGVMTGYGTTFNDNFYFGGEASLHDDTASKNQSYTLTFFGISTNEVVKVKYKRSFVVGVSPRFGVILNNSYLFFVKPGIEISRDRLEVTDPDGIRYSSKQKSKFAFVPGLGIEKAFYNILLRVEYNYSFGAKTSKQWWDQDGLIKASAKYTSHTIKVGLSYQF